MKRCCVFLAVLAIAGVVPRTAHAGILSWLDQLSGPGPFVVFDATYGVHCFEKETKAGTAEPERGTEANLLGFGLRGGCQSYRSLDERFPTWFVTAGAGVALRNELRYPDHVRDRTVRFLKVGTGIDYTAHRTFDIGAGVGVMYFDGRSFPNFSRIYVEPVRVSFRPLLVKTAGDGGLTNREQRLGAFMVYANWNILISTLEGKNVRRAVGSVPRA